VGDLGGLKLPQSRKDSQESAKECASLAKILCFFPLDSSVCSLGLLRLPIEADSQSAMITRDKALM